MHKQVLTMGVAFSLLLSLTTGYSVNARAVRKSNAPYVDPRTLVDKYIHTMATFNSGTIDRKGLGSITVSRVDDQLGTVISTFSVTSKTKYLRKNGTDMAFKDFVKGDSLSMTLLRNPDGSQTPTEIVNNNSWVMEDAVTNATINSVSGGVISATNVDNGSKVSIPYTPKTLITKPRGVPGTTKDLVPDKNIRVRAIMRLIDGTPTIEQALAIWIIPEHGE